MNPSQKFKLECEEEILKLSQDDSFKSSSLAWMKNAQKHKYSYHFEWLGRPIIQYPQDIIAFQELIWKVKPDLIIETGIAHGGSLIFSASMLELNALCGGPQNAHVLGIDIDIREHNRASIEAHPLYQRITLKQGSSIEAKMIEDVKNFAKPYKKTLLSLDSNHTHDHVLAELEAYASLVSPGSYCIVFDTIIEHFDGDINADRPWGKGNNPMTAVDEFLKTHPEFAVDDMIDAKLMISVAPRGYLKKKEVI